MCCFHFKVLGLISGLLGLLLMGTLSCVPKKINIGHLEHTLSLCHDDLKWKRFVEATRCYSPERRRAFQKWFRSGAEDIHIDSMELHELELLKTEGPVQAKVVVGVKSYRLPDTTLKSTTITELWQFQEGQWFLAATEPDIFELGDKQDALDPSLEEK